MYDNFTLRQAPDGLQLQHEKTLVYPDVSAFGYCTVFYRDGAARRHISTAWRIGRSSVLGAIVESGAKKNRSLTPNH